METSRKSGRPRRKRGPRGRVAEALRAARAARGWTQAQAAEDLGIPQSVLAAFESGARKPSWLAQRFILEAWAPKALERAKR